MSFSVVDETLPFAKLVDADGFRDVCRSYSELYGVGIKIFAAEGDKVVDIRANTGDHCGYLYAIHPTRVLCTNLVNQIKASALDAGSTPKTIDCFSGLRYKVMPIVYEGTLHGRVIFGPFAPQGLTQPPASLAEHGPELSLTRLAEYQAKLPRVNEAAAGKILENLRQVLDVLIHAAYKAAFTSRLHIASIAGAFADLERSNASLKIANDRLQELDRLKSNFVATVSHELRTPLTSVIGYSEMLLEGLAGDLTAEQRTYVGTILEKGESLLGLIGQVLDMARVESGNAVLRKELTDVRKLLGLCLSDVTPQARKGGLTLESHVASDVTPILVDPDKIRRIITNLLGNAVKFTERGGTVRVALSVVDDVAVGQTRPDPFEPERNRFLQIEVQDTGIGIPLDKQHLIFESFYQVDNGATRQFGGTGLGLSIVRNFVQAHRGRVRVESTPG
ncbi:MAG TPA: ATP-binding protein, partial [Myxococcota bacterium]|nr:ATP-binding protein [Myxococcota bacterium]